jgi:hypothetical protein
MLHGEHYKGKMMQSSASGNGDGDQLSMFALG